MPYDLVADKVNSTLEAGDHPDHHNALANAVNDLDTARVQPIEDALSSAGDNVYAGMNVTPQRVDIRAGTSGSPLASLGPILRVSKTDAVTRATYVAGGGDPNAQTVDETAAVHGANTGTSASQLQVTGVIGTAKQAGNTSSGSGGPDACGVFGHGWVDASDAVGRAIGAYFVGRSESTTGKLSGVEVQAQNRSGSDHTCSATSASSSIGLLLGTSALSTNKVGAGIQFTHGTGDQKYDVGIAFASNDGGPCASASIRDNSSVAVSLDIAGSHSTAAIRLQNGAGNIVMNDNKLDMGTGFVLYRETSAPVAPAADQVKVWAQDNGSGKTQLMALFSSGVAQQIAIQP